MRVKIKIVKLIESTVTLSPTLAKNTGDSSIYETVSNLEIIYDVLWVPESIRPATNAPVMSETPKKCSETYCMIRQNAKDRC